MAEQIFVDIMRFHNEDIKVASCGLNCINGSDMTEEAKQALINLGIEPYPHFSTRFEPSMCDEYDLIITMTTTHKYMIGIKDNVFSMQEVAGYDIADPYGGDQQEYDTCASSIKKALEILYEQYHKQMAD